MDTAYVVFTLTFLLISAFNTPNSELDVNVIKVSWTREPKTEVLEAAYEFSKKQFFLI